MLGCDGQRTVVGMADRGDDGVGENVDAVALEVGVDEGAAFGVDGG
jgi:hypothetical protein